MGVVTEFANLMPVVTDSLAERYLEYIAKIENLSPKTVQNRRHILIPFFRFLDMEVEGITLQDIDRYFIHRVTEVKLSSIGAEKQTLRSFFRYCQEYLEMDMAFRWDVIRRKKDKPNRVRAFTPEEVAKVINLCPELQDRLVIALLFETGMRIGELLGLQIADIRGTQICIRGKGDQDRVVFMSPALAEAIADYTHRRGHVAGFVFRPLQFHKNHTNDRYVSAYTVRDRIQKAFARCGHKMHPHLLRHSFAINWITKGGDIRNLQLLMGHANIETTMWYLRFVDPQTQAIYHRVLTSSVLEV
jgi:integrase/recombinase XerD